MDIVASKVRQGDMTEMQYEKWMLNRNERVEKLNRMEALTVVLIQKKGFPRRYMDMVRMAGEHIDKARKYLLGGEDEACVLNVEIARDLLQYVYEKTKNEVA